MPLGSERGRTARDWTVATGASLIELMFVVALAGVLGSMALLQVAAIRPGLRADGAMRLMAARLNEAREAAIVQRREMVIEFPTTNSFRILRREVPTGTTRLGSGIFEDRVGYGVVSGVPDTPDAFGNGGAVDFGAATSVRFTSEGMFVDSGGTPINGTVFLRIPGEPRSARAVTVLGATGRVRSYRWNGRAWIRV